jgi:DNA-binding transcriptional MerR regulator
MDANLTISQVAERTGLTAHTLRYYERIGLIAPVLRVDSGHRSYAAADMDWLAFLIRLRATGMPIQRMQEFARLRSEGNATAGQRRKLLDDHLRQVMDDLHSLQQSVLVLKAKIKVYAQMERSSSHETPPVKGKPNDADHNPKPLRTRARKTARD